MSRFGYLLIVLTTVLASARSEELSRIGLVGEVPRTARRLAAADELAAQEKWADAVDEYQRILTEAGDDLITLDARHSLQARRVCHLRLAALPPAALRAYRTRVDSQAKKWLDQGTATRDPLLLRRLVDEAFCSRHADRALDLLGDLAFERGSFEEAEHWWRMLAVPIREQAQPPFTLLFPDPQVDVAGVRAKQLLARLFRGDRTSFPEQMRAFRALHGTAKGQLAGRQGLYADTLQALADQQETLVAPPGEVAWPTFAASPSRNAVLPKPPGRWAKLRSLDGPQWTVRLDADSGAAVPKKGAETASKVVPLFQAARSLAFHPVIQGNRVFVADARRVMGYSLLDGREILHYDLARAVGENLRLKMELPAEPDLTYTLSVAGDRVYARLGAQSIGPPRKDSPNDGPHTYLVCLDLQFGVRGRLERWRLESKGTAAAGPVFEGAPVVGDGRVFIAESRFAGGQTQTAIACYDADTGQPYWQTEVCNITQDFRLDEGKQRSRHHLLTLTGSTLFYCSHSGAIVAVDAETGRRLWAVRYPGQAPRTLFGETLPRDPAPCLFSGCRLYVAPLDSDRILCLDPETGQSLWESGPLQVIHLLGVAKGRLIFTAATPRPCIRAVEAATGKALRSWMQPADGSELKTFGRGVLAGDWVFWPVRSDHRQGVYVLAQETGEPVYFDDKINGNLAVGGDCLAAAGIRDLLVYVPEGRLLQRRREEAARLVASTKAQFRLALAQADAGLYADALTGFDHVEAQGNPEERWNGKRIHDLLDLRRHEMLLDAAEHAQQAHAWEQASHFLSQAAGERFPLFPRLAALSRQAALWTRANRPERAIAVWQSILEDGTLRAGVIADADGTLHAAASLARERIAERRTVHGPAVPTAVERQTQSARDERTSRRETPALRMPLVRAWQTAPLSTEPEDGERFLQIANGLEGNSETETLVSARGHTILCRDGRTGKLCWQCTLPQKPQWFDCFAGTVIVAGLDTLYGLCRADGGRLWSLCLAMDKHPAHLSVFQRVGPRLFLLHDERRLFAMDVRSGDLLWSCWAPAARLKLPFPSGRFCATYHAGPETVLIQTGMGRWLVLDSRTGRPLRESDRAEPPWPRPPLRLDEHRTCVVTDAGQVMMVDSRTGVEIWTFAVNGPTSLTGEALQILGNSQALLLVVARNYGYQLECLDTGTGRRRWPQARYLGWEPIDLEGGALDETAVYLLQKQTLRAHALVDGRLLWKRPLPAAAVHWQTVRTADSLITFPRKGHGVQWQARWLFGTIRVRFTTPPAAGPGKDFPLLVCDPRTGQLMQRLNFPAAAPHACLDGRWDTVAALLPQLSCRVSEIEDAAPTVHVSKNALTVSWDGQASGLAAAARELPPPSESGTSP